MAFTLTVLCPNARRQTVKVTPNTSVLEVLELACKKQGLKPDDYDIKHFDKALDLSLSVRFANLPNNALLELSPIKEARQERLVTVAVLLESGERFTGDYSPSSTMWEVISKCSKTCLEDAASNVVPVCIYMRQKFIGEEMKTTTLRSIGLTGGKAIIRLMYRSADSLNEQAHVSSPLCRPPPHKMFKTDDSRENAVLETHLTTKHTWSDTEICSNNQATSVDVASITKDSPNRHEDIPSDVDMETSEEAAVIHHSSSVSQNDELNIKHEPYPTEKMDEEMESEVMEEDSVKEIGEIKYIGPRNAVLFNLSDILNVRKQDLPDEFFELTINDVRYLYNDSRRIRQELENEPLLLKRQREARAMQHLAQYGQSVIRVYFPDRLVLQGTFFINETIQTVMDFVRSFLQNQNLNFHLYIAPPKEVLSPQKTLLEMRLVPAAVVHFGCDVPDANHLCAELYNQISDPRAATRAAAEQRKAAASETGRNILAQLSNSVTPFDGQSESPTPSAQTLQASNLPKSSSENKSISSKKVPAWFKLGQK